jgi:hypothetical protein
MEIKIPFSQIKNIVEGHSSRLEQVEDRISEPEDKIDIKEKNRTLKQLKSSERNMQELSNSSKGPNLRIRGIKEREEVQPKGIHNIFNQIITENFPNLKKELPIQVQEASRTPNRLDQNRTSPKHIITKTTRTENRERIVKPLREKKQLTYKGKPIKLTANFSTETLKTKRAWSEVCQALKENNFNPRILYPTKLSCKIDGGISLPQ